MKLGSDIRGRFLAAALSVVSAVAPVSVRAQDAAGPTDPQWENFDNLFAGARNLAHLNRCEQAEQLMGEARKKFQEMKRTYQDKEDYASGPAMVAGSEITRCWGRQGKGPGGVPFPKANF